MVIKPKDEPRTICQASEGNKTLVGFSGVSRVIFSVFSLRCQQRVIAAVAALFITQEVHWDCWRRDKDKENFPKASFIGMNGTRLAIIENPSTPSPPPKNHGTNVSLSLK